MTLLEVIDSLCAITRAQADIIQKQAEALEQAKIADSVADELRQMRESAADDLARIFREYN